MLIANGTVHDGKGNAYLANVRITNGTITEVAPELAAHEGEEVFDATGMEVMPGFVQALGHWGVNGSMTEIRPSSQDNDELSEPITPDLKPSTPLTAAPPRFSSSVPGASRRRASPPPITTSSAAPSRSSDFRA